MKNIQSLIVLLILTVLTPTPSSFADSDDHSNWKTYGFTEIEFTSQHPGRQPTTAGTSDNSFEVFIDNTEFRRPSYATFVSNNILSLKNDFHIKFNYHQSPETNNILHMSIGLSFDAAPPFYYGHINSISADGSGEINYNSKQDTLNTRNIAKDTNQNILQTTTSSIPDFKKSLDETTPSKNENARIVFNYVYTYDYLDEEFNPIQDRNAGFSDLKVTAAPEPITTTLFLVGGGLMGLSKLRRKKA